MELTKKVQHTRKQIILIVLLGISIIGPIIVLNNFNQNSSNQDVETQNSQPNKLLQNNVNSNLLDGISSTNVLCDIPCDGPW
jgi:hypothetical protein